MEEKNEGKTKNTLDYRDFSRSRASHACINKHNLQQNLKDQICLVRLKSIYLETGLEFPPASNFSISLSILSTEN